DGWWIVGERRRRPIEVNPTTSITWQRDTAAAPHTLNKRRHRRYLRDQDVCIEVEAHLADLSGHDDERTALPFVTTSKCCDHTLVAFLAVAKTEAAVVAENGVRQRSVTSEFPSGFLTTWDRVDDP